MRCAPLLVHLHQTSRVGVNPPRDGRGNAPLRAPDARASGKPVEKAVDPVWVCVGRASIGCGKPVQMWPVRGGKAVHALPADVDRTWITCGRLWDVRRSRRGSRPRTSV